NTVNEIDSEEVENDFVEDNGNSMDGLVDVARKKVEAPPKKIPRKTGIWEDIEEMEHENAYSKKS
ncbi:hypothetical protein Tco_0068318, partial [Tanacetum coccineum]